MKMPYGSCSVKENLAQFIRNTFLWRFHDYRLVSSFTRIITFFWGPDQQRSAIFALEFIKVGTDLYLVLGSFEQAGEDGAAFRGGIDVLEEPHSPAGPVGQTVPLDVLRLTVNLEKIEVSIGGRWEKMTERRDGEEI